MPTVAIPIKKSSRVSVSIAFPKCYLDVQMGVYHKFWADNAKTACEGVQAKAKEVVNE